MMKLENMANYSSHIVLTGFLLALPSDRPARRVAQKLGFHILDDPVDFARKVGAAASRRVGAGHVVLAPVSEDTDYAVCARLGAMCLGAYLADSRAFCRKGRSCGVQYEDLCHGGGQGFKVAVSARLASQMPTLPLLLRALAEVPRGSFAFYSERGLRKVFRKAKTSREVLKMAIFSLPPTGTRHRRKCRACTAQSQLSAPSTG